MAVRRKSATTCRTEAVNKKSVKVGKDIPWNLFTPKAPYQGKVVENDVHSEIHVTFDHGGKVPVPYIEGQSIGVMVLGPDKKGEQPAKTLSWLKG